MTRHLLTLIRRAAYEAREEILEPHKIVELLRNSKEPILIVVESPKLKAKIVASGGEVRIAEAETSEGRVSGEQALRLVAAAGTPLKAIVARLKPELVEWGPQLSVYITGLDLQHRQLIRALNALYQAVLSGEPKSVLAATLDFLSEYARFHFTSEERFFEKYGYPKAQQHRREHEAFTRKVEEFKKLYKADESETLPVDVLAFMAEWTVNHIMGSDKDYGVWAKKKGII